ncbi:UDP-glycosyltransferase 73C6-like [Dioscorea cayenensis subsp. rotundata]|uniref:Glycosyltransferase n=1 Tax=Dioscorea cayennensis subsp. rotundata TaxID=55577 RepID=A0AB40CVI5_DIOCR|nr:UDP-glycosyltransferase 73C6-like [Dioscorea cayenensis subsp. rotundata]
MVELRSLAGKKKTGVEISRMDSTTRVASVELHSHAAVRKTRVELSSAIVGSGPKNNIVYLEVFATTVCCSLEIIEPHVDIHGGRQFSVRGPELLGKQTTIINDANNSTTTTPPHVVLVPLFAQGHIIPMLDMARLLAQRGVLVTFITTPVNASRIKPIIARVHESKLPINFIEIPFPCAEAGIPIPLGCENFDLLPSPELFLNFFDAIRLLSHPLEQRLRDLVPLPTCMINDMWNLWTANVARSLSIRRLVFHGPFLYYRALVLTDDHDDDVGQSFKVSKAHSSGWSNMPGFEKIRDEVLHAAETVDGVVMNTLDDVELMFVEAYKKVVGKDVWTVGPLCLYDKDDDFSARIVRGNKTAVDQEKLFGWLDSMEENSVLYVSFGTLTQMKVGETLEIGSGLEASGVPFIWVIKDVEKSPAVEEWLEGFEKRMSLRSIVIKGWAPQAAILSHKSVGGFVSHCGWNSTLEAISNGVPMITWPQIADQFLNERLVVKFLRMGIAIGVKKPMFYFGEDEISVSSSDVERAVRGLMGDGQEAQERRIRATEIKGKAIKAMEEGGSSYENITMLVEYIKHA